MSRNKKEANKTVFAIIDSFSSNKGYTLSNSGKARWIESDKGKDTGLLVKSKLINSISFSPYLKIAQFDLDSKSYFCTIGYEISDDKVPSILNEESVSGGFLTAIIAELKPFPNVSVDFIRDIIEVDDLETNINYKGHQAEGIKSIFPQIRCFSIEKKEPVESYQIFFLLCLCETMRARIWIDDTLLQTFFTLVELNPETIPYQTLCRSIFDTDPSSVYLALYRCLEALYAYSHVRTLMPKLGIEYDWHKTAEILENSLGWRPREESSLAKLLANGVEHDLREILLLLNVTLDTNANLVSFATNQIYQLRNALVHYRPFHKTIDTSKINWNKLCELMAYLVLHVYDSVET